MCRVGESGGGKMETTVFKHKLKKVKEKRKKLLMIQKAFKDDAMSAVKIKVWHKHLQDGGESVESDSRSGRPATSKEPENVKCEWAAINKGWPLTV